MKGLLSGTAVIALGMSSVWANVAQAQDKTPPDESGDIVVTGSLITRPDFKADTPIVTVDSERLKANNTLTLDTLLDTLPQFAALNPSANYGGAQVGGSHQGLDLRALGPIRTLVLLDGRRMQPSDPTNVVDINTIPTELIDNIETITGGASATYGSDAVAGVVNIKLRRKIEGVTLNAQYGITERGDGANAALSMIAGGSFAGGKGSAVMDLSYAFRDFSPQGDRPLYYNSTIATAIREGVIQQSASNLPSQAVIDSVFRAKYGLSTSPTVLSGLSTNADGTLFAPIGAINFRGDPKGYPDAVINGNVVVPYGRLLAIQEPIERFLGFGRLTYDFSDSLRGYAQVQVVNYKTVLPLPGTSIRGVPMSLANPFIPADLRTILASRPNPTAPLIFDIPSAKIAPETVRSDNDLFQAVVGLDGKLFRGWTWQTYGTFGRSQTTVTDNSTVNAAAYAALLSAADGGTALCAGKFNPFIQIPLIDQSASCYSYVSRPTLSRRVLSTVDLEGLIQGSLFSLPGGVVHLALGVDYRRYAMSYDPDQQLVHNELLPLASVIPIHASDSVSEAFGELLLPIVKDLPLLKDLTVDLGVRVSSYKSVGRLETYKATGIWQPISWLRVRGGYERAARAPNLGELNSQAAGGQGGIGSTAAGGGDPCDIASAYRTGANGASVRSLCIATGVPANIVDLYRFIGSTVTTQTPQPKDLKAENAYSKTIGIVLLPGGGGLFKNASLSVDYYNIKVKGAIGFITAATALSGCFNGNGGSNPSYAATSTFCRQITRDSGGNIVQVNTPELNLASYETSGIDIEFSDKVALSDLGLGNSAGVLRFDVTASRLLAYKIQSLPGAVTIDYAGSIGNSQIDAFAVSHPTWKVNATVGYSNGPAYLGLTVRYTSKMFDSADACAAGNCPITRPQVNDRTYFDLSGSLQVAASFTLRLGVMNLLDKQPPYWAGGGFSPTDAALFDIEGRRFFIGVTKSFK